MQAPERSFVDIDMPERFVLECLNADGEWIDWAACVARDFERLEGGAYVCTSHGGSPTWLRCLRQEGSVIYVLDGGGGPYTYRLHPFPASATSRSIPRK